MGKLDLLMRMNQPVDVTVHELAYQYPNNNLDVPFTRKTIGNTAPPELDDDDLPESITETIVQSVHAFLLNTPSLAPPISRTTCWSASRARRTARRRI